MTFDSSSKHSPNPRAQQANLRWLAVPITLGIFSLLTVGYLSSFTPVQIIDRGKPIEVRTRQSTVEGALRDAGVSLLPEDIVVPGIDTPISRNDVIEIQRAKLVKLNIDGQEPRLFRTQRLNARDLLTDFGFDVSVNDALRVNGEFNEALPAQVPIFSDDFDERPVAEIELKRAVPLVVEEIGGQSSEIRTTAQTVGESLLQAGHIIYLADRITPPLGAKILPDMKIAIERAKPVTVWVDGRQLRTRTHSKTVADLLAELKVILLEQDYTRPSLDEPINANDEVRVIRVSREIQIRQDPIPFQTRWEGDNEIELDTQVLWTEGAPGVREQRDWVTYEDGLEVKREQITDFVARETQNKIYKFGTKVVIRTLDTSSGPVQYWRKVRMLATSYSASTAGVPTSKAWFGKARCGMDMRRGIVAVDPRVVSLRTNVYVDGYGVGLACDTGSAILGKRIDLGYDDSNLQLWYKWVDVYLLTPVPPEIRYRLE
jgi:uncharacterized protein YabE (DUF348 family)